MATVRLKFRASADMAKESALFYRVIHNRIVRQINSGYRIYHSEWDKKSSKIVIADAADDSRRKYLRTVENAVKKDIERIKSIISLLSISGKPFTSDIIVKRFRESQDNAGLVHFARILIYKMKEIGKERTAESYATATRSFFRFSKGIDIPFDDITSTLIVEYEAHLKSTGLCPNTISYYMRNLRAIYNRAVEDEITLQRNPPNHEHSAKRQQKFGLCEGYFHVQFLYTRDVVCRYGVSAQERPAQRIPYIPKKKDRPTAAD